VVAPGGLSGREGLLSFEETLEDKGELQVAHVAARFTQILHMTA
jgi:hypothetical protein